MMGNEPLVMDVNRPSMNEHALLVRSGIIHRLSSLKYTSRSHTCICAIVAAADQNGHARFHRGISYPVSNSRDESKRAIQ